MYTYVHVYIAIIHVHVLVQYLYACSFRLDSRCADSARFPGVWWQLSSSFWHHSTTKVNNAHIPYSRVIRRMRLYLHRKRICAYKQAAPNKEQRLNSSTCDVHVYSARPMQTTPYIITI